MFNAEVESEVHLIGALLLDIGCIKDVYSIVTYDMFSDPLLRSIYKKIIQKYDTDQEISLPVLAQELENDLVCREEVIRALSYCLTKVSTTMEAVPLAKSIKKDYKNRQLKIIKSDIETTAASNVEEEILNTITKLEQLQRTSENRMTTSTELVTKYKDSHFTEHESTQINFGLPKLDETLGDLEGGDVIVIGARPGVGKSALCTQVISHLCEKGKKCGYYNLEMSEKQVYQRIVARLSGLDMRRIRFAKNFEFDEQERYELANQTINKWHLIVSCENDVDMIYREVKHQDLDVLIIDYLQLMQTSKSKFSRREEVGELSRKVKKMAMRLNIPIILLSQLNRVSEGRETKEPEMADLRETGDIEQDASIIILLWNPDKADLTKKGLKVAKNRQGEMMKTSLKFEGRFMRFTETNEHLLSELDLKKKYGTDTNWKELKDSDWEQIKMEDSPFDD